MNIFHTLKCTSKEKLPVDYSVLKCVVKIVTIQ